MKNEKGQEGCDVGEQKQANSNETFQSPDGKGGDDMHDSARDLAVQALLDKQGIYEVMARYSRALDRCDEQLLRSVFHPGAIMKHGDIFTGSAEEFCSHAIEELRKIGPTSHYVCNVLIELDEDRAYTESYGIAYHRLEKDREPFDSFMAARILERYERRGGVWKIAYRWTLPEWSQDIPAGDTWSKGILCGLQNIISTKDRSDPSYELLKRFYA